MASDGVTGSGRHAGSSYGLLRLIRRLIDALTYWVMFGEVRKRRPQCPGPMAYYIVTDACDLAECEACGYIAIAGTVYDARHVDTPHKEGLAT